MKKETKNIIQSALKFLEGQSQNFRYKVTEVLDFMKSHRMEVEANSIYYWRDPGSKNLRLEIAIVENDEYRKYNCKLNQNLIVGWNSVLSLRQNYIFWQENGEKESIELELQLESIFMNWFIFNWYQIGGHELKNCKQIVIENSSGISFDLNSMNYESVLSDAGKTEYKYSFKLSKQEIEKRLRIFGFEMRYINSIKRTMSNHKKNIELEISNNELSHKNLPEEYQAELKEANVTRQDFQMLKAMTKIVDKLIQSNYKEI